MLASQGPSMYGRSPPAGFLPDCAPLWFASRVVQSPLLSRRSAPEFFTAPRPSPLLAKPKEPSRSCIHLKELSKVREKKRVVFADDNGLILEHVKTMPEPSHVPPFWTIMPPDSAPQAPKNTENWQILFSQPASDYIAFGKRINEENLSLENVIVHDAKGFLTGTIKVKNLDFNKEVIVRLTTDKWRTSENTTCSYSSSKSNIDTFTFKVQLPTHSRRLEFCVCFKCLGTEYWDSNYGTNYILEKPISHPSVEVKHQTFFGRVRSGSLIQDSISIVGSTPYW